jgi:hypothetical protein
MGVALDGEEPTEYPLHIAVYRRLSVAEGDAQDGTSGVFADARQCYELSAICGQQASVAFYYQTGCRVKIPGSGVVPEALPGLEHATQIRGSQALGIRETGEELTVVGQHGRDLRLLEHHHRYPDSVGVVAVPPGEIG